MTTIAYKDGILAADSRASNNGYISHNSANKIIREIHPEFGEMLFAVSGDAVEGKEAIKDILIKGQYKPFHNETYFNILGIDKQGNLRMWCLGETHTDGELLRCPFYATGSGKLLSLAAMECGKSAVESVEIASKFDPFTGGLIYGFCVKSHKIVSIKPC